MSAIDTRHGDQADADDYVRRLVDTMPPLTEQQRERLALLLRPDPRRRPADAGS